jgi:hypothetical protein
VYCSLYRYTIIPQNTARIDRKQLILLRRPAKHLILVLSMLRTVLMLAVDNMYRYRPRETSVDTLFTGVAVDAVDILRPLLDFTIPLLPFVILACAEEVSCF